MNPYESPQSDTKKITEEESQYEPPMSPLKSFGVTLFILFVPLVALFLFSYFLFGSGD